MITSLSSAAIQALIDVGTNRQGATISARTANVVVKELRVAGLIGDGMGLTRRGTIARERFVHTMLVTLF